MAAFYGTQGHIHGGRGPAARVGPIICATRYLNSPKFLPADVCPLASVTL
jgi:hypothetical protein